MAASRRSMRASAVKIAPTDRYFEPTLWSGVGCVYRGNDVGKELSASVPRCPRTVRQDVPSGHGPSAQSVIDVALTVELPSGTCRSSFFQPSAGLHSKKSSWQPVF